MPAVPSRSLNQGLVQIPLDWVQTAEGQFIIFLEVGIAETGEDLMLLPLFGRS